MKDDAHHQTGIVSTYCPISLSIRLVRGGGQGNCCHGNHRPITQPTPLVGVGIGGGGGQPILMDSRHDGTDFRSPDLFTCLYHVILSGKLPVVNI